MVQWLFFLKAIVIREVFAEIDPLLVYEQTHLTVGEPPILGPHSFIQANQALNQSLEENNNVTQNGTAQGVTDVTLISSETTLIPLNQYENQLIMEYRKSLNREAKNPNTWYQRMRGLNKRNTNADRSKKQRQVLIKWGAIKNNANKNKGLAQNNTRTHKQKLDEKNEEQLHNSKKVILVYRMRGNQNNIGQTKWMTINQGSHKSKQHLWQQYYQHLKVIEQTRQKDEKANLKGMAAIKNHENQKISRITDKNTTTALNAANQQKDRKVAFVRPPAKPPAKYRPHYLPFYATPYNPPTASKRQSEIKRNQHNNRFTEKHLAPNKKTKSINQNRNQKPLQKSKRHSNKYGHEEKLINDGKFNNFYQQYTETSVSQNKNRLSGKAQLLHNNVKTKVSKRNLGKNFNPKTSRKVTRNHKPFQSGQTKIKLKSNKPNNKFKNSKSNTQWKNGKSNNPKKPNAENNNAQKSTYHSSAPATSDFYLDASEPEEQKDIDPNNSDQLQLTTVTPDFTFAQRPYTEDTDYYKEHLADLYEGPDGDYDAGKKYERVDSKHHLLVETASAANNLNEEHAGSHDMSALRVTTGPSGLKISTFSVISPKINFLSVLGELM